MQRLEDYPQTDEGGVAFVRDIFKSMGGTVVNYSPPWTLRMIIAKMVCLSSKNGKHATFEAIPTWQDKAIVYEYTERLIPHGL